MTALSESTAISVWSCRHSPRVSAPLRRARSLASWEIPVSRPVRICILRWTSLGKPVDPAPYLGVPRCDGKGHRASNDRPDTEGKIIGGRKNYLILPPGEGSWGAHI